MWVIQGGLRRNYHNRFSQTISGAVRAFSFLRGRCLTKYWGGPVLYGHVTVGLAQDSIASSAPLV